MQPPNIRPMAKRKYAKIPLDRIKVLNSRNRDHEKFKENIRSIRDVGLLKPIVVNERQYSKTGYYELVCGQGRFLAYKSLGYSEIPAEIINCDRKEALLYSLVENIARVPPGTMWFAQEVKRMHDAGCTLEYIANITGHCTAYIANYIRLVEQGEERLIKGVEANLFPISFAVDVAKSEDSTIQNTLMDAFDKGIVNCKNLPTVKNIIELRLNRRRNAPAKPNSSRVVTDDYTMKQLKADIRKVTKEKEAFVNEASLKENRLLSLRDGLNILFKNRQFVELATAEGLGQMPSLQGTYNA
jgi:ParB family transcriptional regulator, chromosome partitioning protein